MLKMPDIKDCGDGFAYAIGKCVFSGVEYRTAKFPVEAYNKWAVEGAYLQDALPMLDPGDREFLKTGISPQSFDETFAEEDG